MTVNNLRPTADSGNNQEYVTIRTIGNSHRGQLRFAEAKRIPSLSRGVGICVAQRTSAPYRASVRTTHVSVAREQTKRTHQLCAQRNEGQTAPVAEANSHGHPVPACSSASICPRLWQALPIGSYGPPLPAARRGARQGMRQARQRASSCRSVVQLKHRCCQRLEGS